MQRSVTTVETVPPVGPVGRVAVVFALLVAAVAVIAVASLTGSPTVFTIGVIAVAVIEIVIYRWTPIIAWALERVGAGAVARGLLVGSTLVVLAVQTNKAPMVVTALLAVLMALAASMARSAAAQAIDYLRRPPVMTRGVDLSIAPAPRALPPGILRQRGYERVADVPAALGLALAAFRRGPDVFGYVGLGIYVVLSLVLPVIVVGHTLRVRKLRLRTRVAGAAVRRIGELDPRIVLYFGDGPAWRYQVEVWLRALEATGEPVLIMVRDRAVLRRLAPTTLPIVCVPTGRELMQLPLTSLRGALFVGNNSNNIHMLRRPGVTSVFIGHGDSDKDASRNPFSRAYNEIWVAGPAGRERYRLAGVGVGEHAFREIGRPQLESLTRLPDSACGVPALLTVLYAPTWEGWGETPNHSSLAASGVALVRALLARPGVRVMYRPHPRTGHLRAEMRRADAEVRRMLHAAGATESTPRDGGARADADRGDALDVCLAPPAPAPTASGRIHADEHYWHEHPGHRILNADGPDLYASFRAADALVADVSSVVTDFLAAGRPYAIVNSTAVDNDEFRATVPAASGGFVLRADTTSSSDSPDAPTTFAELDGLLAAAADPRQDPTTAARSRARTFLLGPAGDEARHRFHVELARLAGTRPFAPDDPGSPPAAVPMREDAR